MRMFIEALLERSARVGASTANAISMTEITGPEVTGQRVAAGAVPVGLTDLAWERVLTQIEQGGTGLEVPEVLTTSQDEALLGNEVAKLTAGDAQADDSFGVAVALDGDRALVGALGIKYLLPERLISLTALGVMNA